MGRITIFVPDEALTVIDSVTSNRSAFMTAAALAAARAKLRELEDAEIERICAENAEEDLAIAREWESTLMDGMHDVD